MSNGNISLWELPADLSQPMPKDPVKSCAARPMPSVRVMTHLRLLCSTMHLRDYRARRYVRKRQPERTGHWIVRSCFGGCNESFILSGSEECKARSSNGVLNS